MMKLINLAILSVFAIEMVYGLPLVKDQPFTLDLYGNIRVSTSYVSQDSQSQALHVSDHKSRIGIKGKYKVDDKLSMVYKAEFGIDFVDQHKASNNFIIGRDAYVGLETEYGTISMGRMNTPYKVSIVPIDIFNHTLADADAIMGRTTSGKDLNLRNNNSIMYTSPNLLEGKLKIKICYTPHDDVSANTGKKSQSLSSALSYHFKGFDFTLATHHEQGGFKISPNDGKASSYRFVVKKKYKQHQFGLAYEMIDSDEVPAVHNRDAMMLSYQYQLKKGYALMAQYVKSDATSIGSDGAQMYTFGVRKSLSKKSEIYALYTHLSSDGANYALAKQGGSDVFSTSINDKVSGFSIGYNLTF